MQAAAAPECLLIFPITSTGKTVLTTYILERELGSSLYIFFLYPVLRNAAPFSFSVTSRELRAELDPRSYRDVRVETECDPQFMPESVHCSLRDDSLAEDSRFGVASYDYYTHC